MVILIHECADLEGDRGPDPPPPGKSQSFRAPWQYCSESPGKSQSQPASNLIGPPMKRNLMMASLKIGVIFIGSSLPLSKHTHTKRSVFGPLTKLYAYLVSNHAFLLFLLFSKDQSGHSPSLFRV